MKYNLIEIKPTPLFCKNRFDVKFDNTDSVDRVGCKKYTPNRLGFFHYPRKWDVDKAFTLLKQHLIDDVDAEIERLNDYRNELLKVSLPERVTESDKKQKCKK